MVFTCKQVAENLSALEEGEASAIRRAGAALHLWWCRDCQAYVAQFRALRRALANADGDSAPAPAEPSPALAAFLKWQPGAIDEGDDDHDLPEGKTHVAGSNDESDSR